MQRRSIRAVGYLLPATRAGSDDDRIRRCGAYSRQQATLRNLHRNGVVFGLIAERPGHAAAARIDFFNRVARQGENSPRWPCAHQCLLVAVTVE